MPKEEEKDYLKLFQNQDFRWQLCTGVEYMRTFFALFPLNTFIFKVTLLSVAG
jgi:hypothetical protein